MNRLSIVLIVAAATIAGGSVLNQHQKELEDHYKHISYIAEFNCHRPQPRVVSVSQLFPESETEHRAFFPDVTVLHVCDNGAGCCTSGYLCLPKHREEVLLPFKITYMKNMGKHTVGSWEIKKYALQNHTECECVDESVCIPPTAESETYQ